MSAIPPLPLDQDLRLYLTRLRGDMAQDVLLGLTREMRYGLSPEGQPIYYNADHYDVHVGLPSQFEWFAPGDAVQVGTVTGRQKAMPDRPYRALMLLQSPEERAAYDGERAAKRHWPALDEIEGRAIAHAHGPKPWRADRNAGDLELLVGKILNQVEPKQRPQSNIMMAQYEAKKLEYFASLSRMRRPAP